MEKENMSIIPLFFGARVQPPMTETVKMLMEMTLALITIKSKTLSK
jgi:hypothetical protein